MADAKFYVGKQVTLKPFDECSKSNLISTVNAMRPMWVNQVYTLKKKVSNYKDTWYLEGATKDSVGLPNEHWYFAEKWFVDEPILDISGV